MPSPEQKYTVDNHIKPHALGDAWNRFPPGMRRAASLWACLLTAERGWLRKGLCVWVPRSSWKPFRPDSY